MVGRPVRLRIAFADVTLVRRGDPRAVNSAPRRSALQVKADLDGWLDEPRARAALVGLAGLGGRPMTEAVVHRARNLLLQAVDRGEIVALESRIRRVIMSSPNAKTPIGPDEQAPLGETFLWTVVFDASGAPLPDALGVTFDALERGKARFENLRLRAGGAGVSALPLGSPASYSLKFTVPDDAVPPDAAPVGPPRLAQANVNENGPLSDPVLVTRRELASKKQNGMVDVNNVFQLRRRQADVIEFEHFNDGSAVFLPAEAPEGVYRPDVADRPLGIDLLKATLVFARDFTPTQMVITGHDSTVSQQRADCMQALLLGDDASRTTWTRVAVTTHVDTDIRAILKWAAETFGWDSDPDQPLDRPLSAAIQELKIGYNRDVRDALFPVVGPDFPLLEDGQLDPATWGAVFDCYMRALRPVAATVDQPPWAKFPVGDESTRTAANAARPRAKHPFVVLGTNGPGNAPVTIAQYGAAPHGAGDPNLAFTAFQHVNPQYRVGVDAESPGQALNVPDAWAENLAVAGYTVERDPMPLPAPPAEPGPAPLAAPGPLAVGCGAHHLAAPFADATDRRAARRHAEIAFLGDDVFPAVSCGRGDGACSSASCELYDPREFELSYVALSAISVVHAIRVLLFDSAGNAVPSSLEPIAPRFAVELPGGRRIPARSGTPITNGFGEIRNVRGATSEHCSLAFLGILDRTVPLPVNASPPAVPNADALRSHGANESSVRQVTRNELVGRLAATLDETSVFQLRRRRAQVIEVEHFHPDGAVFLPGRSPLTTREPRQAVSGIDVLRRAITLVGSQHCFVIGHHPTLSEERAHGVVLLLRGERENWAALSARVATPDDKDEIRRWAAVSLPRGNQWTQETWLQVFDLYASAMASEAPFDSRHAVTVAGPVGRLSLWAICRLTWGHLDRIRELEDENPGVCAGPWEWNAPIELATTVVLPPGWPPTHLVARGHTVVPLRATNRVARPTNVSPGVGCGTSHLFNPNAGDPRRREQDRRVEIVILDSPALVCQGSCSKATCEIYDPSQTELAYVEIAPNAVIRVRINGAQVSLAGRDPSLVVADVHGRMLLAVPAALAEERDGDLVFSLERHRLPRPAQLSLLGQRGFVPFVAAFDPLAVA